MNSRFVLLVALLALSATFTQAVHPFFKENPAEETEELLDLIHKGKILKDILFEAVESVEKTPNLLSEIHTLIEFVDEVTSHAKDAICGACKNVMNSAHRAWNSEAFLRTLNNVAFEICAHPIHVDPSLCHEAIPVFSGIIQQALGEKLFNPERACGHLLMCPKTWERERLRDYVKEVLLDKPDISPPKPTGRKSYKILHITDLHLDLEYAAGSQIECDYFMCCRNTSQPSPQNQSEEAGWWASYADKCDIPLRTIEQMFMYISENFEVDVILWTGDNISHDLFNQSSQNQTLNTYMITKLIQKYFPNAVVFAIQGNHECYPVNIFDYYGNSTSWLPQQLAVMWKQWMDDEAFENMNEYGFYSMYNANLNLKVLALDTQACNTMNFYLWENPTDPYGQLEWIRDELYAAEANNQSVFIIGHIPPNDCEPSWVARYNALVDRFSFLIRGQFFGHTHVDEFEITRSFKDKSPINVVYVNPSVTTRSNLNPSFRIFDVDSDTAVPTNYYQYRLNFTKWNSNITGPIEWDLAYDFVSEYGLPDISPESYMQLVESFKDPDQKNLESYILNLNSGYGPIGHQSASTVQHLYCQNSHAVSTEQYKCLGLYNNIGEIQGYLSNYKFGLWYTNKDESLTDVLTE